MKYECQDCTKTCDIEDETRQEGLTCKECGGRLWPKKKPEPEPQPEAQGRGRTSANRCTKCDAKPGLLSELVVFNGERLCKTCAKTATEKALSKIVITTTNNVDGYEVQRYVGIESVEIVIGTGLFSEFGGDISDFFGLRSTGFEKKLQDAKQAAFKGLKYLAFQQGANAVVGIDIDYTEFSGNRIGLIVNGTLVSIVPESDQTEE